MRKAGVGNTRHVVDVGSRAVGHGVAGHDLAVAVAHHLDVLAFVVGVRITVVRPEEGAQTHLLGSGRENLDALGRDLDDFLRSELIVVLVAELVVDEALERDAVAVFILADENGQTTELVAGDNNAVGLQEHDRFGALNNVLGVANALDDRLLAVDERADEFGGVHLARAHREELGIVVAEVALDQVVGIVDDADRRDRKEAEMGPQEQRLRIVVRNAADAAVALHVRNVRLEAGAERRVRDVVDLTLEALLRVVDRHAAELGAEVGVVVDAEEGVENDVALGYSAEEAAHFCCALVWKLKI